MLSEILSTLMLLYGAILLSSLKVLTTSDMGQKPSAIKFRVATMMFLLSVHRVQNSSSCIAPQMHLEVKDASFSFVSFKHSFSGQSQSQNEMLMT